MHRSLGPLVAAAAAVLLVASCGAAPEELKNAEALECPSGSDCYDPPKPIGPGGEIVAEGGEFFFELTTANAVEGPIKVTFRNVGAAEHNFTIDEAFGDVNSVPPQGNTPPGGTDEATLDLFAGTWTYYCSVPGHREAGMEGTLTVEVPDQPVTGDVGTEGEPVDAGGTETEPVGEEGAATPGEGGASPQPTQDPATSQPEGPEPVPQQTE
ncbi:MAG: cupredoxin domain-containing protein [Actinomycetota bacterium]|nr:cupredoxin domain-containing protein [Actinomycetota bacterium]